MGNHVTSDVEDEFDDEFIRRKGISAIIVSFVNIRPDWFTFWERYYQFTVCIHCTDTNLF